jgi:4-hydroxy-tetrahydrodipicolinate synthase
MFSGSYVALVTPFKNGKIDEVALTKLIEFQIKNGTTGIVPCGTTGESATLSFEEHEQVIEISVKAARQRIQVIAGTGSNSTSEAIYLTEFAKKAGCDGALLVSPYYNKPTQKGLYLHFKAIADAVDLPLMLYNIQSRTAVNIAPETFHDLARDCKNIVAIKEASGSLEQMSQMRALCPKIDNALGRRRVDPAPDGDRRTGRRLGSGEYHSP